MKSNLLSLTVAAMLCCTPFAASARDTGRSVGAQFETVVPSKLVFKPVPSGRLAFGLESASANECQWQVLNIPVRIGSGKVKAKNGEKVTPNYVPAMTFHVYLCIDPVNATDKDGRPIDKKSRPIVLDKEITYVDIPLKKAQGATHVGEKKVDAVASINVGVFLSPADIRRIVEKDTAEYEDPRGAKSQPEIKLLAVAMEAKYNEAACWFRDKTAKEDDIKVSSDIKSWLPGKWWKKGSATTRGASLRSINETPFAASFYPTYCATRPMYGSNPGSSVSSPSSLTPSSALGDPAETTAADAAASDGTGDSDNTASSGTSADAGDTEPAPATPSSSGRKSRRSRSSR